MTINLNDEFYLESDVQGGYHLHRNVVREKVVKDEQGKRQKTGESYKTTQLIGYNMSIESAIKRCTELKLHEKEVDVTFKEYIELYRKVKNELLPTDLE